MGAPVGIKEDLIGITTLFFFPRIVISDDVIMTSFQQTINEIIPVPIECLIGLSVFLKLSEVR